MQETTDLKVFSRKRMTPDELIRVVAFAHSSKTALAKLLTDEKKLSFLAECTAIEKSYTCRCASSGNPCLQGGCAMSEGEICLEALLNAEPEFSQRIYRAWLNIFKDPSNRTDEWKK